SFRMDATDATHLFSFLGVTRPLSCHACFSHTLSPITFLISARRPLLPHSGALMPLIPARRLLSPHSGALMPLISARRPLLPHSGALMPLISARRPLSPHSGALMPLIPARRPLSPHSGALVLFISAYRPLLPHSGALMPLISTSRPLLPHSGALMPLISTSRPLSADNSYALYLPLVSPSPFSAPTSHARRPFFIKNICEKQRDRQINREISYISYFIANIPLKITFFFSEQHSV
ncbi:hypothetical protein J2Z70_004201, partial [Paenibacillus silagei]|nr:hypothetical protein [Paenibacillus silagei]